MDNLEFHLAHLLFLLLFSGNKISHVSYIRMPYKEIGICICTKYQTNSKKIYDMNFI